MASLSLSENPLRTRKYLSCCSGGSMRRNRHMNILTSHAFIGFSSTFTLTVCATEPLPARISWSRGLCFSCINVATCCSAQRLENKPTTETRPERMLVVFCGSFGDASVVPYRFGKYSALSRLKRRGFERNVLPWWYRKFVHSRKYGLATCRVLFYIYPSITLIRSAGECINAQLFSSL